MLFNRKIDPCCAYCKRGYALGEGEVICLLRGVLPAWEKCRRFSYDPLRRIPPKTVLPDASMYSKKDFEF